MIGSFIYSRSSDSIYHSIYAFRCRSPLLVNLHYTINHYNYQSNLLGTKDRTCIRKLKLIDNPLGPTGLRSILRLLCAKEVWSFWGFGGYRYVRYIDGVFSKIALFVSWSGRGGTVCCFGVIDLNSLKKAITWNYPTQDASHHRDSMF